MDTNRMQTEQIRVRDPFVLVWEGQYYLYGTRSHTTWGEHANGVDVYVSSDLQRWSEAVEVFHRPEGFWATRKFWAPEVHIYNGAFYMFLTLSDREDTVMGTQILRAESPLGPFMPISDGPVTPRDWLSLDGTLHVDGQGKPWMVFCHEWRQIRDGAICLLPLTEDLTAPAGPVADLFHASEAGDWVHAANGGGVYVTDGPFLYKTKAGPLLLIWSSFTAGGQYAQAVAVSESGDIQGPWQHQKELLFQRDGGHGMIFRDLGGSLQLVLHKPNTPYEEHPAFFPLEERDGRLVRL